MKFSTKEDLEIPIEDTFDLLSDFESFERAAMRHGAEINRLDDMTTLGVGMGWTIRATLRGKARKFRVEVVEFERPNQMCFEAHSRAMKALFLVEVVALSRKRTRMRVELDIRPRTLSARLLMQSVRLARNTLNRRYKSRISHFASDLEDRHKRNLKQMLI